MTSSLIIAVVDITVASVSVIMDIVMLCYWGSGWAAMLDTFKSSDRLSKFHTACSAFCHSTDDLNRSS